MELKAGAAVAALDDEQRRHGGLIRDGRRIGGGGLDSLTAGKPLEASLGRSRRRRKMTVVEYRTVL
jgi:hypothetical protein